jgi:23S rRNA (uracil1939-C5)-methyltransferase
MKLEFKKIGINGEGIGYIDKKPVFCDGVLPNETAEVEIIEKKNNYAKAQLKALVQRSSDRVDPGYEFYIEEGCPLMIMKYASQLQWKKQLLEEALYKYAHIRRHFVRDMHESPKTLGYRSQCKLPVQVSHDHLTTGMYMPGTNHYHPIDRSLIQDEQLEDARIKILQYVDKSYLHVYSQREQKGLRYLVIRSLGGKLQCTLVTGKDKVHRELADQIMTIEGMTGVFQSINTDMKTIGIFGSPAHKLAGNDTMPVKLGNITLQLSPEAFYQLNAEQAEKMYRMAVSKIDPCDTLVEAYCGIGAMSLLASSKARHVIGIESNEDAVKDAASNAEANHISNCTFLCEDAAEGLEKASREHPIDCLLVDPPRAGMDDRMIQAIIHAKPRKVIYISCNPATLGKNLNLLKHDYHVVTVIPYDLFPHTPHVESITVLEKDN